MAKNRNNLPSIQKIMTIFTTIFVVSLLVVVAAAMGVGYLTIVLKQKNQYFVIEIIALGILLLIVVLVLIFTNLWVYNAIFKGLYVTSKDVIKSVTTNKHVFPRYPKMKTLEFEELNDSLDRVEDHLAKSVIFSKDIDYDSLGLTIANEKLGTIEYNSFYEKIPEIVMMASAYRNAFIHISYGQKITSLQGQSSLEIIKNIRRFFNYDNMLIVDDTDGTGFIVYTPEIDSMNRLNEECELFIKSSSMVMNTPNGKAVVLARISIVIYPYSDVEDIMSDLSYADRQGMNVNVYLPDRSNKVNNEEITHGSYSLNCANSSIASLAAIRIHDTKNADIKELMRTQLKKIGAFINADYVGVIVRDDRINKYMNFVSINNKPEVFLKEGEPIASDFLDMTKAIADPDGSYYFSTRAHLNPELGNFLDKSNLNSGFLYVVSDDNGPLGLVYFLNHQREMHLDSFLHESVFSVSFQIGSIIRESNQLSRLRSSTDRNDILMKLSNYMMYAIDKNTYDIVYTSETFEDTFGKCKNKKCFKAIYGFNQPCVDCPIISQKKMLQAHKNVSYETSIVLNDSVEDVSRMLIKRVEEEGFNHNRFDQDFLINSFYSLTEDLENIYNASGRGNILVLAIENYKDLLEAYGNEGYVKYVRRLTEHLNERFSKDNKFYLIDNSKVALVIPDSGNNDIIDVCEKIYNYSKEIFIDLDNQDFIPVKVNYIAVKYPQEFPTHTDLLRHTQSVLATYDYKKHVDEIYFDGQNYWRSASRTEFINEVIDKSFKEGSFKVNLQPILHSVNRHIVGAEILIRLSDDYRGQQLNAYEVMKAAAEQNKVGIISDGLINYIGDVYQKYGLTLFKTREFTRLSLNTDYSYFSDENFLKKISILVAKYTFPKNFLAFEIVEQELSEHYDTFKSICSKLKMIGVHIAVDQYTGKYLSLEKIKALDIPEIKITRNMVKDIDVNKGSLTALTELVKSATAFGLQASVVGVENKDQYFLIRDMAKESLMQGFFFYAPLELPQLIEAVKVNKLSSK